MENLDIAWGRYIQALKDGNDEQYCSELFLSFCFDLNRWIVELNYNWEETPNYDSMEELYHKLRYYLLQ